MPYHSPSRNPRQGASASTGSYSSSISSTARPESNSARNYIESLVRTRSPPYQSPYAPVDPSNQYLAVPDLRYPTAATSRASSSSQAPTAASMSTYSSASDRDSIYSSPGPQDYQVGAGSTMSSANPPNTTSLPALLHSLRSHTINTLPALRRTERLVASLPPSTPNKADIAKALHDAWIYYVDYHSLLNELRGLTKTYPFSESCLEEAKRGVGKASGNYCYGVLKRVKDQGLVPSHARALAARPAMWGGRKPTATEIQKLASACEVEWTRVLNIVLRHWES